MQRTQTHVQGWYQKTRNSLESCLVCLALFLFRVTEGGNRFKSTGDTQKATWNGGHGPKKHDGRYWHISTLPMLRTKPYRRRTTQAHALLGFPTKGRS